MGRVNGRPRVVAVVGASGGCGASTLTAAVCRSASDAGWSVVAVDGQPGGGGLDVVLALDHLPGVRWPDLTRLRGAVDGPDLIARLPRGDGVAVLSHGRDGRPLPGPGALSAVVAGLASTGAVGLGAVALGALGSSARGSEAVSSRGPAQGGVAPNDVVGDFRGAGRGGSESGLGPDLVVVDASREATVGADRDWWAGVDLTVVVAGTGVVELAALSAVTAALDLSSVEVVLVLRGERVPGRLCDDVEDSLGCPVLVTLGNDPSVARDLGRGRAPGSGSGGVARAAGAVLAAVGLGPASGRAEESGASTGRSSRRAS